MAKLAKRAKLDQQFGIFINQIQVLKKIAMDEFIGA